jgi:hypothetical protein
VGQALQQLGPSPLLDARAAVDDEVLLEPDAADLGALEREGHPRVATDVVELAPRAERGEDDVAVLEADPHAADLRAAVLVVGHQVRERVALDDGPRVVGDLGHAADPTPRAPRRSA